MEASPPIIFHHHQVHQLLNLIHYIMLCSSQLLISKHSLATKTHTSISSSNLSELTNSERKLEPPQRMSCVLLREPNSRASTIILVGSNPDVIFFDLYNRYPQQRKHCKDLEPERPWPKNNERHDVGLKSVWPISFVCKSATSFEPLSSISIQYKTSISK